MSIVSGIPLPTSDVKIDFTFLVTQNWCKMKCRLHVLCSTGWFQSLLWGPLVHAPWVPVNHDISTLLFNQTSSVSVLDDITVCLYHVISLTMIFIETEYLTKENSALYSAVYFIPASSQIYLKINSKNSWNTSTVTRYAGEQLLVEVAQ